MSTRIPLALLLGLLGSVLASAQDRQRQVVPQSVFTVRGVAFSEDQQKKADDVQKKYTPHLSDLQREIELSLHRRTTQGISGGASRRTGCG